MRSIPSPTILESESGYFHVDENGIAQQFVPSDENPYIYEVMERRSYYTYEPRRSIRTFVVPEGIKGFKSDFLRGIRVIERFELPESLVRIGNNSFHLESEETCVFANCILPEVVIPETVCEIGVFAFGHSDIEILQFPVSLRSPYGRQFKDSHIGKLRLPKEWKGNASLDDGCLVLNGCLTAEGFGYLSWPSTLTDQLEWV